jgi:hypothetical protein
VFRIPVLPGARAGAAMPLGRAGTFTRPTALAQDRLGAFLVTVEELRIDGLPVRRAVAKLHAAGRVSLFAGELGAPQGFAFDAAGNLYIADGASGRIVRFLAPPAPELGPLRAVTNEPSIRVSGAALAGSRLDGRVDGGSSLFTTQGGAGGGFTLTMPLTRNAENTIEVFATAQGGDGLTGAAAEATVRHDDTPPETVVTHGPSSPTDEVTIAFTFTGVDDVTAPDDLRFTWRIDGRPFSEFSDARSVALTDLQDGAHTFEVVARDRAGNVDPTPAARTFTISRDQIALVEPEIGATVPAGLRLVRGTLAIGGPEVSVLINGVAAAVHGNSFAALVQLTPATTRLHIVASAATGVLASQEVPITVAEAPDSAFLLVAGPRSGVAPLTVAFALLGVPASATIEADFDGNGTIDFAGPRLDGHAFTYAQPGLYSPRVSVTDSQGQRVTIPSVIQVFDRAGLDALLQSKWTALRDALRRGEIAQALSQISERSRGRYQQALTALSPDLPAIDNILTDVRFVRTRGLEAIFEMARTDAGILKSFEVRFHVDADGFWRVRSF